MRSSNITISFLLAQALLISSAEATIHYVDINSTNPVPPYLGWDTAAVTIQDAENVSATGDEILVTNGVYQAGGTADSRIAIFNASFVHSVNGPEVTIIQGYQPPATTNGAGSIRCANLGAATLAGFTLINGAAQGYGGGVYALNIGAVVSNCIIVGNVAPSGGGVYSGKVRNCTIAGNLALGGYGGGAAFATLLNCTLVTNKVTNLGFGGAAYQGTLTNCVLSGNSARMGGGARFSALSNCVISNNVATSSGGGVQECTLQNCTLINNSAQNGGGGYASTNANCLLIGNTSTNGGGAYGGILSGCTLISNNVTGSGGGAYDSSMTNCLLLGNSASKGGAAYADSYLVYTVNCTVISNSAATAGGVWFTFAAGVAVTVLNDILYWNNAATDPDFHGDNFSGPPRNLAWCCVPTGFGDHSISNSPLFVDAGHGDFRLLPDSPCINGGRNSYVTNSTDMDGNPRIVGGTVDIGAYEFQNPQSVISYGWLLNHGLSTDGSADYADADGDGMNNWQEWVTNTDPTNSLSYLHMLAPDPINNFTGVTIHWASTGMTYFLQRSTNLAEPFTTFATNFFAGVGIATYRDAAATNTGPYYYRVGAQP
jgi:hypothetical protein